jgi:hypothetical protein
MTSSPIRSALLALALVPALAAGCSISKSSESLSKSISSPFESSSKSSPGSKEAAFRNDVRDLTATQVSGGSNFDSLERGISSLAKKHGITDWEASQTTYEGVGEGLAKAKLNQAQLLAYQEHFAYGDASRVSAMQKGYDAVR